VRKRGENEEAGQSHQEERVFQVSRHRQSRHRPRPEGHRSLASSTARAIRRLLADFLIGAHAHIRGYRLLSLDERLYRAAFPTLKIEAI
jgi:hypothetical protein